MKKLTITELNALSFEISFNWEDYRVVLIVWSTIYSSEGVDAGKFLDESVEVPLEFHSAVLRLESELICR